jgi:hypothetical protein
MKLLHKHGNDDAGSTNGVSRETFVPGDLRELSVGLWQGNALMYCAGVWELSRVSGHSLGHF